MGWGAGYISFASLWYERFSKGQGPPELLPSLDVLIGCYLFIIAPVHRTDYDLDTLCYWRAGSRNFQICSGLYSRCVAWISVWCSQKVLDESTNPISRSLGLVCCCALPLWYMCLTPGLWHPHWSIASYWHCLFRPLRGVIFLAGGIHDLLPAYAQLQTLVAYLGEFRSLILEGLEILCANRGAISGHVWCLAGGNFKRDIFVDFHPKKIFGGWFVHPLLSWHMFFHCWLGISNQKKSWGRFVHPFWRYDIPYGQSIWLTVTKR